MTKEGYVLFGANSVQWGPLDSYGFHPHLFPGESLKAIEVSSKRELRRLTKGWITEWTKGRKGREAGTIRAWGSGTQSLQLWFSSLTFLKGLCAPPALRPCRMQTCSAECQHFPQHEIAWVTDSFIKIHESCLKYRNPCYATSATYLQVP